MLKSQPNQSLTSESMFHDWMTWDLLVLTGSGALCEVGGTL